MLRGIQRRAHFLQRQFHARGCFVMHGANRLDAMVLIGGQGCAQRGEINTTVPIGADHFSLQGQILGHLRPALRKMAGFNDGYCIAGGE